MISVNNLLDNRAVKLLERGGPYQVVEWKQDLSLDPSAAQQAWFMSQMGLRKRQLVIALNNDAIILQAGAMQWFAGAVEQTSGIRGIGDMAKKMFAGKVTGESAVKPMYAGDGIVVCEPTYKYLLVEDLANWRGGMVIEDGMFLSAQSDVNLSVISRKTLSSAVSGGEGLFNLCLKGKGYVVLESPVPKDELIEIELKDDVLRIDGPMAIAWDASLRFTVERSGKTLMGSAASGEGLVNVYRGSGKVWMIPTP